MDGEISIQVIVRRNCKRMIMHCYPTEKRVMISVPPRTSKREVERFIHSQESWIKERMRSSIAYTPSFTAGERHPIAGRYAVLGAEGVPVGEKAYRAYKVHVITEQLKILLPLWEKRIGVHCTKVTLRQMKTRWGSCSMPGARISLNLNLAAVKSDALEYVLVHELCHILHQDHSPAFYAVLACHLPDWKTRKQGLKLLPVLPPEV